MMRASLSQEVGICSAGACVLPRCGDGQAFGEECDDGNDNPHDGCDQCRRQRFEATLVVSGAVGSRRATETGIAPSGVAVDPLGRVYVADQANHRVLRVNVDGTITTIAGTGTAGFSGDGGLPRAPNSTNPSASPSTPEVAS
jgi:cysteine-rich repeat protein